MIGLAGRKPTLKQCMFDPEENPGIDFFRGKALSVFTKFPDLSMLDGWKMTALRVFGFAYALTLIGWLLAEGVTIWSMAVRILLMSLFFGIVYARTIAGFCYGILCKWETFK